MPTAQIEPSGLLVTVLMMYSVLPLSSAACTTSHGTSGCTMTRMPGCCRRSASICFAVKRVVDRAVPLPQDHLRALHLLGIEAAEDLVRIPHDHLVERDAHLVGGVAPEMLIGQEQNLLAALERPLQRGRRVRRRADGAAALADERLDRRRRVDVGHRARRPVIAHLRAALPSTSRAGRARPCRPSSSRPRGPAGSPADAARTARRRSRP